VIARKWLAAAAVSAGFVVGSSASAAEAVKTPAFGFSALKAAAPEVAKARAATWLKSVGKMDQAAFDKIWNEAGRPVVDRVADTLALGNADAAKLLADVKKTDASAPTDLPAVIKESKDAYFQTNLAVAFAKSLSVKRVYEEALAALTVARPEEAVDPSAYFFYKAVAEHALIKKEQATRSITRLLDDVTDAPDRYKMVATLMFFEMQNWSPDPKDLANIEKLMDNSGRRLDLARAGKETQEIQKKIVFRLDEIIKEAENKQKQQGQCNGGNCPNGSCPGGQSGGNTTQPSNPANDSVIMGGAGAGKVDDKKLRQYAEQWGTLPPDKRAEIVNETTRDLPAKYKPMIEDYFKSLNRIHGFAGK